MQPKQEPNPMEHRIAGSATKDAASMGKLMKTIKRITFLLLGILFISSSAAYAEEQAEWIYEPGLESNSELWAYLAARDEALNENMIYEPVMCLGADNEIQSWLIKSFIYAEEASDPGSAIPTGNYVVYIQMDPSPKIISIFPAGTPLEKIKPVCEVKLLLDSESVLDEEHLLRKELKEAFRIGDGVQTISAVYLDTPERDFLDAGWINRIRVKEGKPKYTITYKKRYAVENNDLEATLAEARTDGFSLYDAQFPAELDWGYSEMTLSFSADVDVKTSGIPDIDLLERTDAAQMLAEQMPSEENDREAADWGKRMANSAEIVGPIHFLRYTGSIDDQSIRIEIWPVSVDNGTEYIVEFSAEAKTVEAAAALHSTYIEFLDEMGILLHRDGLKTQRILKENKE